MVLRAQCAAVDSSELVAGGEQGLDVESGGVGHEAVGVGDADDAQSRLGEKAGGGSAHGSESLDDGGGFAGVAAGVVQGSNHRGGHTEAADEFVLGDAVDDGGEGFVRPCFDGGRIIDEFFDGGKTGAEFAAGEDLVDVVLADAEVFPECPVGVHDRVDVDEEAFEDACGSGCAGVEVDSALGTANGHIVSALAQMDRFLAGHPLGESAHLLEGAAFAHAQTARSSAAHKGVDDDIPECTSVRILPSDVHEHGAPKRSTSQDFY